MFLDKHSDVVISGQLFPYDLFQYLLSRFKEAFCHSSLTIEQAFKELDELEVAIHSSMDYHAFDFYCTLGFKEKKEIDDTLKQIIVFKASRYGVFNEALTGDPKQIDRLFQKHFSYFVPYLPYFIAFDKDGKFDKRATYQKVDTLFMNLPRRNEAYKSAYHMQKDSLDAFDYAMDLDQISIRDAIQINNIVNRSDVNQVLGFKRTNNDIIGASFTPVDKKDVPLEMQKLFSDYRHDFGKEYLNPNDMTVTAQERSDRVFEIFRKEALFHIRFIRIHPFNDGNGRTGRIILNHHLLEQGIAPVILSGAMAEDYCKCIDNYDVDGLAKILYYISSVQIANWVSEKKAGADTSRKYVSPNNQKLASLVGYEDASDTTNQAKKPYMKKFLF